MIFNFFKKPPSSFLGIDIGTTGIRIVQLGSQDGNIILENYASIETKDYLEILGNGGNLNNIKMSDSKIAKDLENVIEKSGIISKKVAMSIPISSAFSSIMVLPNISDGEIAKAVDFEARQYIPIPINEVVFDWSVIGEEIKNENNNMVDNSKQIKKIKVLLVAIPKETTSKYMNIAETLGLKLIALETESFSLARSLAGKNDGTFTIVDIGNRTTSVTIVENGSVIGSHTVLGAGGEEITKIISHGFNVDFNRAENLKIDVGFSANRGSEKKISEVMLPIISIIISEIKKINESYSRANKKNVKKVILTGGTACLPGLITHFSKELDVPVEVGDPWKNITHNNALNEALKENAPFFSVAIGLALRGFEK
ncbi:MAG: type IV pilus assembly protein PilM [Candidatus Pacebacteria bacterium]|nr:type IV pilus assembly protein PilM [Candidatus Paceibacterota bacterium]